MSDLQIAFALGVGAGAILIVTVFGVAFLIASRSLTRHERADQQNYPSEHGVW